MKLWMKKLLVALVAIATLGLYTPTSLLEIDAEDNKDTFSSKADVGQATEVQARKATPESYENIPELETEPDYLRELQEQAKIQSMLKFGPRIAEQVEDEFSAVILPKMESVLEKLAMEAGDKVVRYYGITEQPAKGYGERIFHVTDYRTEEDVVRFHVRRDNRPLEGYYFNFHYHLHKDDFKEHHNLGEIYWDKNTPPKWMA